MRTQLAISLGCVGLASAAAAEACIATPDYCDCVPAVSPAPGGDSFPDAVAIGARCSGPVFVAGATGYAFCDDEAWAYTTTDPATYGYAALDSVDSGIEDSGPDAEVTSEAGPADGSTADGTGRDSSQSGAEDAPDSDTAS